MSGKYRGYNLKRINDSGLLHVSQFSERAKWVLFQKSGESKKTKSNRKVITDLITDNIGKVYIDEAQDIDKDMSIVLKILDSLGVEIYLTGDLNQDLSSRGGLAGLCEERKYEVNHENHRCPENHVKLANVFLSTEFEQSALSTSIGSLNYCLEPEIRDVANLVSKYQLTYVNKSNLRFRKAKKNEDNLETILQSILESALCVSKKDKESKRIFDDSVYNYVYRTKIEKRLNSSNLIQYVDGILKTFDIKNDRRTFARLREALKKYENSVMTDGIEVSTIMGIKGDEADDCLFIMSTDLFSYLSQESSAANKMKCALYVGLTRARKNLTLLLTTEVTKKYSATAISDIMKKLGIQKLPIN
ncbi:hypothetical protein [Furfurilactobacillus milii]|uniref:hypothetical protein n=1 Tax=Furfurilactobacillus milii TaxID=2888272 RepID=UPI0015B86341|nr:hypothetical protein [Furfurilactobacillus milii]MCF6418274.1 hypothetical protein [Furfurilactobacillus milii]